MTEWIFHVCFLASQHSLTIRFETTGSSHLCNFQWTGMGLILSKQSWVAKRRRGPDPKIRPVRSSASASSDVFSLAHRCQRHPYTTFYNNQTP